MIIFVLSEFTEGFFITNQNKNLHPLKVKIRDSGEFQTKNDS